MRSAVPSITSAPMSPQEEFSQRKRRYAIMMGWRVVALILLVVVPMPLAAKLALIVAATLLPWVAVQYANGGPPKPKAPPRFDPPRQALTSTPKKPYVIEA